MNDIGASSLSKMADAKCRYEEMRKDGEEKQKRGIKPEHKLKMPPTGMRSSPSEKDLSKLADSYMGPETILESPDDFSHEQDKSPLSDSGFETRSDKTPSAPQSAESTGPKPLFTDVPPVITETRTEVVHIRSYEHPDDLCEPMMEEATSGAATAAAIAEASASACLEPEPAVASLKDKVKTFQIKVNTEEDYSKSMCLKEETHITTTTRMVYHKPQLTEGSGDRMEETMSVRDIMKAFQSGRDPSKELAGLFEHKAAQDSIKGDELSPRFLDKDSKGKPKVERIIEVHIEKGNTSDPTEVIIRETKKHPDYRSMKELLDKAEGDYEVMQEEDDFAAEESLPSYLDTSRVNTPVSQEEDSRPSSAQLVADDSYKTLKLLSQHSIEYHDDEQSELRGESYRFAEKMLHSEKLDTSHSDTEEVAADQARGQAAEAQGAEGYSGERASGTRKETHFKSKDASDKSGKFTQKDEPYDKLTVLHYTTEPGSPKHAVWMRFTQDRQDRNREKLIYEDRLDRTVKEAEEKLSEVSQFFRDKTEKLNDELQSPEKKPARRVPRETRSGPSSMCSSPEKTQQKREASSGEEWARGSMRESSVGKLFGSERKSASVPSSPERRSQLQTSEEKPKEDSGETPTKVPPPVAAKSSKVTAFKQKFEAEAQKQESSTPRSPKPPVKKFQESKLPVYQPVQGSKTSKSPSEEEKISPKKAEVDKSRTSKGPCPDVSQSGISATAPKQSIEPPPNKNATHSTAQKQIQSDSVRAADIGKDEKRAFEMRRNKDQLPQSKMHESSKRDSGVDIQSVASSEANRLLTKTDTRTSPLKQQGPSDMSKKVASPDCMPSDSTESGDMHSKTLRKKADSQIPVRLSGPSDSDQFSKAKQDTTVKQPEKLPSQIPTLTKTRVQGRSELGGLKSQDSTTSKLTDASSVEGKERATIVTTREGFKGLKSLPVYVSVQSGKGDKDSGGQNGSHKNLITVKQKQATSPQPSPDDDTFEQVSFIDSSGKSPMTPETPSSEEVSYDLMSRTPESLFLMPARPSPIPEVSEESESDEQRKAFSFKESPPEKPKIITVAAEPSNANAGQVAKARRVAYIEFPPPPPLEDQSQPEPKGSSSDADTEMMEVNLQEEHDKHLLAEPIIRVQPPSPVPLGADKSSSSDDESVFQPIHSKKYKFKVDEKKEEKETKPKKQDKNGNHKDNGLNGSGDDEYEQNGNDQSITDCSIATTAEFSHDTDATEIDSLDGYDLQDEDDGLSDQNAKPFSFGIDNRKDVWSTDNMLRPSDRAFSQTRLDVIEEEPLPIEEGKKEFDKKLEDGNENVINEKQSKSEGHSETYFSYKLVEEFNTPFKTVATKGLDFDPWSSKGGDDEVVDARIKDDEPKPFGLAVDDKSQGTSPDTTPARTPTDESTPTSEPNPFPFHEGKMFEMTRSGAIDMSKRDFVEERLQFFQIGPQSPCERTDLRMAIVADHLGLSWTELAREMNFSVDEINHIRVENPNSLTAQSFMLLKKWVNRDGKNATTDALTAALTNINRMDIKTLLEGPIFDYGNISGTRCFADDNDSLDQADGYHNIDLEMQTPTELTYESPTLFRHDDVFSPDPASVGPSQHSTPVRPSDLSLPGSPSLDLGPGAVSRDGKPPTVVAEDTSLESHRGGAQGGGAEEEFSTEEDAAPLPLRDENDEAAQGESEAPARGSGLRETVGETEEDAAAVAVLMTMREPEDWASGANTRPQVATGGGGGGGGMSGHAEEEEREMEEDNDEGEMTQEKLKSLLGDIKLEEGSEDEEMTEEKVQEILSQVEQAEKDLSSLAGWPGEHSGAGETATAEAEAVAEASRTQGSGEATPERQRKSQEGSAECPPEAQTERVKQNGEHAESPEHPDAHLPHSQAEATRAAPEDRRAEASSKEAESSTGPENQAQAGVRRAADSSSDEEQTITTRVFRRRVILKGEQAKNIPGESVTEEQFTDEDGNIVTRKVIRKVVRRSAPTEERGKSRRKRGKGRQGPKAEHQEEEEQARVPAPAPQRERTESGDGAKGKKKKGERQQGKKGQS
ncbi:hypothetical protein AALO_G00281440 [Alosa alosa]|uniref:Death domain-containing protein n=1 Tax=Alosa alosa TaxID=278164 RepID=A0AAV6FJL7_9TELE|nr:hypothetical protein AALO_G00281440 [Alosa alosa]